MPPRAGTSLKRGPSIGDDEYDLSKKPRRSERIRGPGDHTPLKGGALPSPLTHLESTTTERIKDGTVTPPSPVSLTRHHLQSPSAQGNSPPFLGYGDTQKTQPFSQVIYPPPGLSYEVEDEEAEGVWGYLVPLDGKSSQYDTLVLRERAACSKPMGAVDDKIKVPEKQSQEQEGNFEKGKVKNRPSQGYLIGRHPECDLVIDVPTVSNRHCVMFSEARAGSSYALLEDTSGNGTFVNDALVGRNNRRELHDGDEISILDEARFCFRYPRHRSSSAFKQQYKILDKLGKGHFATVYLCVDNSTGLRWAVKKFERRTGAGEKHRMEGLQQEIAVLMAVSHPSLLCLKGAFEEDDGVYLILELAPEGELFNWIVMKQKLSENETRRVFVQLFQSVKYLHERNIVHRDIKPENILLYDKDLTIKLADFGLAKIIGEASFTTTLCGTPSYVAPEILQPTGRRKYTRAVDVWSLGVVLYICLCGFPPFSDELYTPDNPYTLAQQILGGRYDFPSPYWDSVGDPALDLIDRMLTVDPEQRISIDECLEHPWTTGHDMGPAGESIVSTDGLLAGRMGALDFSKRKPVRERTLLSALNEVHVSRIVDDDMPQGQKQPPVTVFAKNVEQPSQSSPQNGGGDTVAGSELEDTDEDNAEGASPSGIRFLATGERGDGVLFAEDEDSRYPEGESFRTLKSPDP